MSSPGIEELLPPPLPPSRPAPWGVLLAFFVPAAALAAGTLLQRLFGGAGAADPVLHWLLWSSAAGLAVGAACGTWRGQKLLWSAVGLLAPWVCAGLVEGALLGLRPLREKLADGREARCRAEGRAVCTVRDFTARCAQAQADPARASNLLGDPRSADCSGQGCTRKWLYPGPFRPEDNPGEGALACFVLTDAQGRGVRHWLMASDLP